MSEEEQQGEEQYQSNQTASNRVGVTLSQSVEGNVIAEVMEEKEGVEVSHYPAEIQEALGDSDEFTSYDFQIEMATHYGRMVTDDETVTLFANPEDAAEELGFDLLEDDEGNPQEENPGV